MKSRLLKSYGSYWRSEKPGHPLGIPIVMARQENLTGQWFWWSRHAFMGSNKIWTITLVIWLQLIAQRYVRSLMWSPSLMMLGHNTCQPAEVMFHVHTHKASKSFWEYVTKLKECMQCAYDIVLPSNISRSMMSRKKENHYKIGDLLWLETDMEQCLVALKLCVCAI